VEERNLASAKQFADFVLKVNKISIKRRTKDSYSFAKKILASSET
jgi:hypothetical protein